MLNVFALPHAISHAQKLIKGLDLRAPVPIRPIVIAPPKISPSVASSQNNVAALGLFPEKDKGILYHNMSVIKRIHQPQRHEITQEACKQNRSGDAVAQDTGEISCQSPRKANLDAEAKSSPAGTTLSQLQTRLMLRQHPGEIIFFKLLHVEVSKASHFFEETKREMQAREALIQESRDRLMERKQHAGEVRRRTVQEQQEVSAHRYRIQRLHQDALRLETFAIMTYCGMSKILKKHDRATGFNTQKAFMVKVVSQANFTSYPWLLTMVETCERWMLECCNLLDIGNSSSHHRTESVAEPHVARLFLDMIERINSDRKRTRQELMHSDDSSHAEFNDEDDDTMDGHGHNPNGGGAEAHLPLKKRQRKLP
jgi:hypothetical protein